MGGRSSAGATLRLKLSRSCFEVLPSMHIITFASYPLIGSEHSRLVKTVGDYERKASHEKP